MTEVTRRPEATEVAPSGEVKLELTPSQFFAVSEVLARLYPPEVAKKVGPSLDDWGKQLEESLKLDKKPDEKFEKELMALIDDPKLFDDPVLSTKIKLWLRARISAVALTSLGEGRSARVDMLQGLRSGQQTPAEQSGQTQAEQPVNAPPIAPLVQPVPQAGESQPQPAQPVPQAGESQPQPAQPVPQAGTTPQAPTTPEGKPTEPPKKETAAEFRDKLQREASSGGLFESFGKAMAALASLMENLKGWDPFKALGLSAKTPETQEKKSTGVKFTEEELAKIALDTAKNKDKVYPGGDKAVEYVAAALNLPLRETPQIFLDSLKDSGMVFEQSMDKLPEIEPGYILFFKKADDKGEVFAYTCAVVTNKEPLKMNMIPDGGGAPHEIAVKESDYYKNSWYGFVKTKKDATQH